jgi:hypothetical protein
MVPDRLSQKFKPHPVLFENNTETPVTPVCTGWVSPRYPDRANRSDSCSLGQVETGNTPRPHTNRCFNRETAEFFNS